MTSEAGTAGAAATALAMRRGTLDPVAETERCLARIATVNPHLNAFCHMDPDSARSAAAASAQRLAAQRLHGPLDGICVAIKDVLDVAGWPTRHGSLATDDAPAPSDSVTAARLRAAGAVLVGKTTTTEYAWLTDSVSPLTGRTVNPWHPALSAGGSSSGSAAAVAAGLVPLAIGTDTGGSVRIPAGFCGVTGFKPSAGRIPAMLDDGYGAMTHIGIFARDVHDVRLAYAALVGPDAADPFALPGESTGALLTGPDESPAVLAGCRVVVSPGLGVVALEGAVAAAVEQAVDALASAGAHVERRDPPIGDLGHAFTAYNGPIARWMLDRLSPEARQRVGPDIHATAMAGDAMSAADWVAAQSIHRRRAADIGRFMAGSDLLLSATTSIAAFASETGPPAGWAESADGYGWATPCFVFNMTGQPAISLPAGRTADGRPLAVQLAAPRFADRFLLRAAAALAALLPATGTPDLTWCAAGAGSGLIRS
ncbi:MAG: amidase family protein [Alphaproteobacteria bacterium]